MLPGVFIKFRTGVVQELDFCLCFRVCSNDETDETRSGLLGWVTKFRYILSFGGNFRNIRQVC